MHPVQHLADLLKTHAASGKLYLEFIQAAALSVGLYQLPVGTTDPQQPHTEDEVYYVLQGEAAIIIGDDKHAIHAGSVIYVPANMPHKFVDISADLSVLVFFAPAEYSNR